MKSLVCIAVLLLLAGSAAAQRRASPSPAPGRSPSPAPATTRATNATAATGDAMEPEATPDATSPADSDAPTAAEGTKPMNDTRIKAFYDSPKAAAERIPELRELNKLVAASPAVEKLLKDKDLVATIFAPNNEAVKGALEYLDTNFPNMTAKELAEMGIVDSLLKYHVTAGNAALTSDRLRNGMKLTMLDGSPITIIKKAAAAATGGRRLLQADDASLFIKTDSNQTVPITDANYQGGKAIIHIIDGVLIPASLAGNYSLSDIPGASNATAEEPAAEPDAVGANATEPATAANDTSAAGGAGAPAPAPAPAPKSSAGTAVAALLAAPALLAVLML